MQRDPRFLVLPLALALALGTAACGGGAAATAGTGGGGAGAATTAPEATKAPAEPTEAAEASEGAEQPATGSSSQISASGVVMPKQVGSTSYEVSEATGSDLAMWLPFKSDDLDTVLNAQGKTRDDAVLVRSVANGIGAASASAVLIKDGDAAPLAKQVQENSLAGLTWSTKDVGGKTVAIATSDSGTTVIYPKGNVMYMVFQGPPADAIEAVLATLP